MAGDKHVALVPEPSVSRYWCISMAKLLFGSWIVANAAALPELVVQAAKGVSHKNKERRVKMKTDSRHRSSSCPRAG
jgi:hypothetical protein